MQRAWIIWLALCILILAHFVGCAGGTGDDDDGAIQDTAAAAVIVDESDTDDVPIFDATGMWVGYWVSVRALDYGFVLLDITHAEQSMTGTVVLTNSDCFLDGTFSGILVGNTFELTADFGEGQNIIWKAGIEDGGEGMTGEYRVEASATLCDGDVGSMSVVRS